MAPLLIDSLVTATSTFCDFFRFTCIKLLTVISRRSILRIQIRGTCTSQTSLFPAHQGPFGVGRDQAGFTAKKPSANCVAPRLHFRRGSSIPRLVISITVLLAEHLPFRPDALHRTGSFCIHHIV